jgi:hypothetical protein
MREWKILIEKQHTQHPMDQTVSISIMNQNETERAVEYLNRILHQAVDAGAATVELERVPEGLEISFIAGGSGSGTLLKDSELESELIELLVVRAGLEDQPKGKLKWNIHGQERAISVEEYDCFGESCFRLKLGRPLERKAVRA